jgi:ketosteroid isomerase-like protein
MMQEALAALKRTSLGLLACMASLAPGSVFGQTLDEVAAEVRAAEIAFANTMADRDLEAFLSHVADEAIFFSGQVLRGADAVRVAWSPYFEGDAAPFSWEPEDVEVLDSGMLAFSSGPVRDPDGNRIGTFNSVWRLEADGRWRVVFDKGCPPCGMETIDSTNGAEDVHDLSEHRLREFAKQYTAAWCSQDPASVAAFFSPAGSLKVNDGAPAVGRAAITEVAQGFMTAFPDMQVIMDELLVRDGGAVYEWTLVGTNTGPGGTGNRVRISGFEEWLIGADGLIAESRGHFDGDEYRRQLEEGVTEVTNGTNE